VWHRRFGEHAIADEGHFERHLDSVHHNSVEHGLAACPHLRPYSSFARRVRAGLDPVGWECSCGGRSQRTHVVGLDGMAGE
jgi:putative transposase